MAPVQVVRTARLRRDFELLPRRISTTLARWAGLRLNGRSWAHVGISITRFTFGSTAPWRTSSGCASPTSRPVEVSDTARMYWRESQISVPVLALTTWTSDRALRPRTHSFGSDGAI